MTDLELATSRTWAEIDFDALTHNAKTLRNLLNPSAKFLAVVYNIRSVSTGRDDRT